MIFQLDKKLISVKSFCLGYLIMFNYINKLNYKDYELDNKFYHYIKIIIINNIIKEFNILRFIIY